VVPETVREEGHIDSDLPAEVVFAGAAIANEASPTVDGTTCSDVYCHGSTLDDPGEAVVEPEWELIAGGEGIQCGAACHSTPPVGAHPDREDCETCHGEVIGADQEFLAPELHINGTLEVEASCDSCHGGNDQFAPPTDTSGNSDTALLSVGAHQEHLGASDWHAEIECSQCHIVPEENLDVGHLDSELPAELTFGDLATSGDTDPEYDFETGMCSDSYCHGETLSSPGEHTTPVWNVVDATQSTCGSCHTSPPENNHPDRDDCDACHGETMSDADTFLDPALHINGVVDIATECDSCHGEDGDPAPPFDVSRRSETTFLSVGAHQAHLNSSDWHAEIECAECHVVPDQLDDAGHTDSQLPAELTFGDLASSDGAEPDYDFDEGTCADSYCHGSTLELPGAHSTPVWNLVDETQSSCGSCHGNPPENVAHPDRDDCASCHGTVMDGEDSFLDPDLHINGVVDLQLDCDSCHGSDGNPAPPTDTDGMTGTDLLTVGAHRSHLGESDWHAQVECEQCHVVPDELTDVGHTDTDLPAELTFGDLATTDESSPVYDFDEGTCSDAYCHGATMKTAGAHSTPVWNVVDNSQTQCDSCHGNPPPSPHANLDGCHLCHGLTMEGPATFKAPELHINGILDRN